MILIKPNQISGEILTLFDEADEKVVIVSPYCKIQKWYKLLAKLNSLQEREIEIEFYVREDEYDTIREIEQIGIQPITIKNLHCKIYFNEKMAIISSMNLLLSSEINSLDIAYKTTSEEEYQELFDFYNRYIKQNGNQKDKITKDYLFETISNHFNRIKIFENQNEIVFKTRSNTYTCFINNDNKNYLKINGILSNQQFEYSKNIIPEIQNKTSLTIECIEGEKGYYNTIWATSKSFLKTKSINQLVENEIKLITENIIDFISEIEKIKNDY